MNIVFGFLLAVAQPPPTGTSEMSLQQVEALTSSAGSSRSIMVVDPKQRADDYIRAFEMLKQEKSSNKVYFEIAGGKKITNVIDLKLLPNNTLIMFRFNTPDGINFEVVEIEDIRGVHHL